MQNKVSIKKDSVQETLVIPLYGRKIANELFPTLYSDDTASKIIEQLDYDFSALEQRSKNKFYLFGALEIAMRQYDLACEVRDYLAAHPKAAVVNLGCGLDATAAACDNGECKMYNIDLPDVIALREQVLPAGERDTYIAADLNDTDAWFDLIDDSDGSVFIAAGVFYYFLREQATALFEKMQKRFKGGVLAFDTANRAAVKTMTKTWIKWAKIESVDALFYVNKLSDLQSALPSVTVSSRGYMLGYNDLKCDSVTGFFRFLSKVGDNMMKMQIIKLAF